MKQPALIFDFGNVVAHFDYARATERLGRPLGLTGPELLERARGLGLNEIVKSYEAGRMTNEEFSAAVCRLVGIDLTHDEFAQAWGDIFWPNESIAVLVHELKEQGYTLVLGSNTNELHARAFLPQFATTLGKFDALVLSYEVGHIKPSVDFYHVCAARAGRPPSECLFIDDLPENVAGANNAGLNGILYTATPGLIEDLKRHGVTL